LQSYQPELIGLKNCEFSELRKTFCPGTQSRCAFKKRVIFQQLQLRMCKRVNLGWCDIS